MKPRIFKIAFMLMKIKLHKNVKRLKSYISSRNNCENIRNGFIVGAEAFYVWNVIDDIVVKGKKCGVMVGDTLLKFAP